MPLEIYELSHPIIKIISSNLESNKYNYRYIGLLLIYEMFRKHVITKKIYIKNIKQIKVFNVINKQKNYLILTNICETHELIGDIKMLIPNLQIIHINYEQISNVKNSLKELIIDSQQSEIFIIEKIIKNDNINHLLTYLNNEKKIQNENIKIGCIMSNENILQKIGNKYSELKLYTTNIIYNNI